MLMKILDACFGGDEGDFNAAFCEGCDALAEEDGETGYGWCPAGDDPSDRGCPRNRAFEEIRAIADGARHDMLGVVERTLDPAAY